jgi:hypothetical protein
MFDSRAYFFENVGGKSSSGTNVMKLFSAVIFESSYKASVCILQVFAVWSNAFRLGQ